MLAVAKKPKKPVRGQGRARATGKTRLVTVELTVALDDALEAFRQADKRTKKAVIEMALEKLLSDAGYWPPAEPTAGESGR
jgi:hypothetical protein